MEIKKAPATQQDPLTIALAARDRADKELREAQYHLREAEMQLIHEVINAGIVDCLKVNHTRLRGYMKYRP